MHITPGCTISLKSSLSVLRQRTHKIPIKAIKPETECKNPSTNRRVLSLCILSWK